DIRDLFARRPVSIDMFGKEDREISSAGLVNALVALLGRPWAEMGKSRKPLTQNRLAAMLRPQPLGISPGNVGPENARVRGYKLSQFKEAFERYLPPEGDTKCTGAQPSAKSSTCDDSEVHSQGGADSASAQPKADNNEGLRGRLGGCAPRKE